MSNEIVTRTWAAFSEDVKAATERLEAMRGTEGYLEELEETRAMFTRREDAIREETDLIEGRTPRISTERQELISERRAEARRNLMAQRRQQTSRPQQVETEKHESCHPAADQTAEVW